jgi:hypothetical protein
LSHRTNEHSNRIEGRGNGLSQRRIWQDAPIVTKHSNHLISIETDIKGIRTDAFTTNKRVSKIERYLARNPPAGAAAPPDHPPTEQNS